MKTFVQLDPGLSSSNVVKQIFIRILNYNYAMILRQNKTEAKYGSFDAMLAVKFYNYTAVLSRLIA